MEAFLHDISWVPPLRTETLTQVFRGFTFLGYTPFFMAFMPLGFWLWNKGMFSRLVILVGIVALTNTFLKDLFQDPRPPLEFALDPGVGDSFGFPSGHAQIAVAMWLWLALEIRRAWAWIAAIVIAAGVVASRVYLGVHDIEDVIGGTLLGLATIVIYRGLVSDQFDFWHRLNPLVQAALTMAFAVPLLAIWPRTPAPDAVPALLAFMASWWVGQYIERNLIGYQRHPNIVVAIVTAIVSVVALLAAFSQTGKILTMYGVDKFWALTAQLVFTSLFATVVVPALLRLLRLAGPRT